MKDSSKESKLSLLLILVTFTIQICDGSLSLQRTLRSADKRHYLSRSLDFEETGENERLFSKNERTKRSSDDLNSKVTHTQFNLSDTRNQLILHWAGEEVIVCLARDASTTSTSSLYISRDYGATFKNVSSALRLQNGNIAQIDKYFNHPTTIGHIILVDTNNNHIFTTEDQGKVFRSTSVSFVPEDIYFDPNIKEVIVALEKTTTNKTMWVSKDFGQNWKFAEQHVKAIHFDQSANSTKMYIEKQEPGHSSILYSSTSHFIVPKDTVAVLTDIDEFDIKDDYMFATKKVGNNVMDLLISYKHGPFNTAMFPFRVAGSHYHIADVSNGQIFVCVTHNSSISNLYIGSEPANALESPKFSLSLERIVFFKPNVTYSDSWINGLTDDPFVDLHHIDGLRGVFIASQLTPVIGTRTNINLDEVITLVTFDQGGQWEVIKPPPRDHDNQDLCPEKAGKRNCSLHLSQRLSQLYPGTRAIPILSRKSAAGFVMATGTVNATLKGKLGVYLSTDGAASWRHVLQGNYLFAFGDHGGVIVAVEYYKVGRPTNELLFSIDEGETWNTYKFSDEPLRVLGLMTEPGENTTVFFIFGSIYTKNSHSWVFVKLDFKGAFKRSCLTDDYKTWSPWDSKPGRDCLLGLKDYYERRKPNAPCYNGRNYERVINSTVCPCSRLDFECDFGYAETDKNCIKDLESTEGVKPEWCKPGETIYTRTKGYRKVPGDQCEETDDVLLKKYMPDKILCPLRNETEFMLVGLRDSVVRIDLNNFNSVETLPLPDVKSVITIEYDFKNNCIYWSDVHYDRIMRLHLDGKSKPEMLITQDIKSVEGLAYDWMAHNLYFADGDLGNIEVIRTDTSLLGRMRKKILSKPILDKPRSIVVHPAKGFLFWCDWSSDNPMIGRSWLNGSNVNKIVVNTKTEPAILKWPNGIALDFSTERIYWVDARLDKMMSSDFDGKNIKLIFINEHRMGHPFAVGIYKDKIYWDDWKTRGIYVVPKDKDNMKDLISNVTSGFNLMDLKLYGPKVQIGENACSSNHNCTHLCLLKPDGTHECDCPDGLMQSKETCLCPDGKPTDSNGKCLSNCSGDGVFKCKSDFCIPDKWFCDGEDDCGDGSDEEHCDATTCASHQFQCLSDKRCISDTWICDSEKDCEDASDEDEKLCQSGRPQCKENEFQCENKKCILKAWMCDTENDCYDYSDEMNCTHTGRCQAEEFNCKNGHQCISMESVCDGERDCLDGSDEDHKECETKECPTYKFKCKNNECIMSNWRCDGDFDCLDHSDEADCSDAPHPLPIEGCDIKKNMFYCKKSKACLTSTHLCDGHNDCGDNEDEIHCDELSISKNSAYGIILGVVSAMSILVIALGVFFFRHRRLQTSFFNFASSHYSTHSGSATFQQNLEEDQDTPVIRGFSDDEPLLIA